MFQCWGVYEISFCATGRQRAPSLFLTRFQALQRHSDSSANYGPTFAEKMSDLSLLRQNEQVGPILSIYVLKFIKDLKIAPYESKTCHICLRFKGLLPNIPPNAEWFTGVLPLKRIKFFQNVFLPDFHQIYVVSRLFAKFQECTVT